MPTINKYKLPDNRSNDFVVPDCPFDQEWVKTEWKNVWNFTHILPEFYGLVYDYMLALIEERTYTASIINDAIPILYPTQNGSTQVHPIVVRQAAARERVEKFRETLCITPKAIARYNNNSDDTATKDELIDTLWEISKSRSDNNE